MYYCWCMIAPVSLLELAELYGIYQTMRLYGASQLNSGINCYIVALIDGLLSLK